MRPSEDLQLATAAFQDKLEGVKRALGQLDFPWYPYDTFGSARQLDALLSPDSGAALKALAGDFAVLDLGCGDGSLTFFLEHFLERGNPIDAIDYPPTNHNGMRGIRALREALGSRVEIHSMDADAELKLPRPLYGLTLMLGILYHLKNPFQVLERLAERSQFCVLSTRIARVTPRGAPMSEEALAYLVGEYELNADESNYWIFSEAGLRRILERSGWRVRGLVRSGDVANSEPVRLDRDERATCLIESLRAPLRETPRLLHGWHDDEGGWRWTSREFSVELPRHPLEARQEPARLEFRFILQSDIASALGAVTVRARTGDRDLGARSFEGAGEHVYTAELHPPGDGSAANAFLKDALRVDFSVDRAYRPPAPDGRELALQVVFEKTGPAGRREFLAPIRVV